MGNYETIKSYILEREIINTHSHHLPDYKMEGISLRFLFENSYVNWCNGPAPPRRTDVETAGENSPGSYRAVDAWLAKISNRSYYTNLLRAIRKLYNIEEPLSDATWEEYDTKIKNAHQNKNWPLEILKNICGYRYAVLDTYWNPGDDNGYPGFFRPIFRINAFLYGYNENARDHNGNNAQILYNEHIDLIDEYIEFMYNTIKMKIAAGCCGLKSAIAYDRSLDVRIVTKEQAQKGFGFDKTSPSAEDIKCFQDYVFERICDVAGELHLPLQIHTGLGALFETNPMRLERIIARHPHTIFVLMHGGYPWVDDIMGLAHNYQNVVIDLCWLPLISPSAAYRVLHELIEVCNMDRICWGCDTHTGEESYGALLAFSDILARVLYEKVSNGYFGLHDVFLCVDGIMGKNAHYWFNV
jgi:hypothetical protein